jgi:hypothetical protein
VPLSFRDMRRHWGALLVTVLLSCSVLTASPPSGASAPPRVSSAATPALGIAVTLGFANLISDARAMAIANSLFPTIAMRFHANAVSLNFPFWESSSTSSDPMRAPMTPSPARMVAITDVARRWHLRVQWRPYLFEGDLVPHIRDSIHPSDPKQWLAHYWSFLQPYLAAADLSGVTSFSLALELRTMLPHLSLWTSLVQRAKALYSGQILYSQQHLPQISLPLTARGLDAYQPILLARDEGESASAFASGFEKNLRAPAMQSTPADLTLEEVSIPAVKGANRQPNNFHYPFGTLLDRKVQVDWFTGACDAFWALHLQGIYYFAIAFDRFTSAENQSASLYGWLGTPSAAAIARCFARSPSELARRSLGQPRRLAHPGSTAPVSWSTSAPLESTAGHPTSISCPTPQFCAMVDLGGDVRTEAAGSWSPAAKLDPSGLAAISCTSGTSCVAVDGQGSAFSLVGDAWSGPLGVDPVALTSISCVPLTTTCAAVDVAGDALFDEGGVWSTPLHVAVSPLTAVSCTASRQCRAVDASGNVYTYAGSWSTPVHVDGDALTAIDCPSPAICVAGDDSGRLFVERGQRWTPQAQVLPAGVASVSCSSPVSCLALGSTGFGTVLGSSTWSSNVAVFPRGDGISVSCAPDGPCTALSLQGAVATRMTSWSRATMADPRSGQLVAISCGTMTFCMAVDDAGGATAWNGSTWTPPSPTGATTLSAVSCTATTCMAVGATGEAVAYGDGRWGRTTRVDTSALTGVSCSSPALCAATDASNQVLTYDGSSWSAPTTRGVPQHLLRGYVGVSCPSPSSCVAIDTHGAVLFFGSGSAAVRQVDTPYVPLTSVSCASVELCIAVDEQGRAITFRDSAREPAWSLPERIDAHRLTSVSCAADGSCVATDDDGGVVTYDGAWSRVRSVLPPGSVGAASCVAMSRCFLVDATSVAASSAP